jgi:hypothetical protein
VNIDALVGGGHVTADDFINAAIDKGQSGGLASLGPDERLVFLVSEAEIYCDMEGIDSLLDRYSPRDLEECVSAFAEIGAAEVADALRAVVSVLPEREESALSRADTLIKNRAGYDYDAIRAAIGRRLTGHCNGSAPR